MKEKEPKNVFIVILLVFSCIITIYSFSITAGLSKSAGNSAKAPVQKLESFSGQSEYYYKPAGDTRIWHVINNYLDFNTENGECHNMSYYTFDSDSVLVINQYAIVPDQVRWDVTVTNFLQNVNNFNN